MTSTRYIAYILIILVFRSIDTEGQKYGYKPEKLPVILHDSMFTGDAFRNVDKIYGFSGFDYSSFDFRNLSLDVLQYQAFDCHTTWPDKRMLPVGFRPFEWLNSGKSPGLGIHKLHSEGITGKGISVAIFDKPINPNHSEIRDKITYIRIHSDIAEDIHQGRPHFHGIACASILCGETMGVAPDARLFYFAVSDDGHNSYNYCLALEKLLSVNDTLPEYQKIRIVSISDAIRNRDEGVLSRWASLEAMAREEGIGIIYSSRNSAHKNFTWGGCPPFLDKDIPENYDFNPEIVSNKCSVCMERILLPADFRTVAENRTDTTFNYSGESGFSWAIPYLAGLAALSLQMDFSLNLEEILEYTDQSKYHTEDGRYVVNPIGLIDLLKSFHP